MWLQVMKYSRWVLIIGVILILYLSIFGAGSTVKMEYAIADRPDSGYLLNIVLYKRYWKLITAEGIFPKKRLTYAIEIVGKGRDWSYRNQKGYFYSLDEIKSTDKGWDFGYAWVDAEREYLYLNLYWVNSPNRIIPSDINGTFRLK